MTSADSYAIALYAAPMVLIWAVYLRRRSTREQRSRATLDASLTAGLTDPASLHPLIDPVHCVGCGSCAAACPEGDVLGVIQGKAVLTNPTHCIGHGACRTACPVGAITLVFGTEKRGVDIPLVNERFETDVPGIYIAGELGGMGLIRNAIEQGRQAMEGIAKRPGIGKDLPLDVVVVGAGPAGFSASLSAMERKLRCVTVEQDSLGGTVSHYPRGKIVMTSPVKLPMIGKVRIGETSKEKLLEFWQDVERRTGVKINYQERLESVTREQQGFTVKTSRATYRTHAVLLAIGRRGTPRKLGVPGEDGSQVVYRLIDPEQYRNRHVLVVGGGDSALEAAASIAEEPGTTVTLSYRSDAFGRAKEKNRTRVESLSSGGRLSVLLRSQVKEILAGKVRLEQDGKLMELPNDAVIVSAGGILPTPMLKGMGITVETKHGTA